MHSRSHLAKAGTQNPTQLLAASGNKLSAASAAKSLVSESSPPGTTLEAGTHCAGQALLSFLRGPAAHKQMTYHRDLRFLLVFFQP